MLLEDSEFRNSRIQKITLLIEELVKQIPMTEKLMEIKGAVDCRRSITIKFNKRRKGVLFRAFFLFVRVMLAKIMSNFLLKLIYFLLTMDN